MPKKKMGGKTMHKTGGMWKPVKKKKKRAKKRSSGY